MKNTYLLLLCSAIICGCGNKDKILLSQAPMSLSVNPAVKPLIASNSLLYAWIDNNGAISGLTANSAFKTTDLFAHFDMMNGATGGAITRYSFNKDTLVFASGTALSPVVHYSENDGFSWASFTPSFSPNLSNSGGTEILVTMTSNDRQSVLALYYQYYGGNYTRTLYKINTSTQQGTAVYTKGDAYVPVAMKFTNSQTGWMLLQSGGTYLAKTADGGITWSTPALIANQYLSNLEAATGGMLAVYDNSGNNYFSTDGGTTWKKTAASSYIVGVSFTGDGIIYVLTNTGIIKSTNGGSGWNTILDYNGSGIVNNLQHLYFRNEQQGLAYASQQLFLTNDGGSTWKTLVYPFPYVMQ